MIGLLLFAAVSIVFSFLCSIWEAVLLSVTPAFIERNIQENNAIGKDLQNLKNDIDRPLSAILTLNTFAHTVGAIGVGAIAGRLYGENYFNLFGLHLSWESLIAGLMTLAILIFSEIIPKTLGANSWQNLASFTAKSIKFLLIILAPFVWVSQLITKALKKDKDKSIFSRADLSAITNAATKSGSIDKSESLIINNLLHLKDLVTKDIMTPRTVMKMANSEMKLKQFYDENKSLRFSRIPIFKDDENEIIGMVLKDDILIKLVEDKDDDSLESIKRNILAVNDELPLPKLFETLTQKRKHIAIVVDNYGILLGLVTLEDLFETLLGFEILDESDQVADMQRLAREKWQKRAKAMGLVE